MVLVACITAASPAASADETRWDTTFAPAAISARLPAGELDIVVVAAGGSPEAHEAATALLAAIRASGRVGSVLDDASLGDLGSASDSQVLARCAQLPVAYVAVVRWLAGSDARVLVSIYDQHGALVLGFTAYAGVPLEDVRTAPAAPLTPAPRPVRPTPTHTDSGSSADLLTFEDSTEGGARPRFFRGSEQVDGAEFYQLVGRPDLASRYSTRNTLRWVMIVGGLGVATLGLIYALDGPGPCPKDDFICDGNARVENAGRALLGGTAIVFGGAAGIAGMFIEPHPVDPESQKALVSEHNRQLQLRTGETSQARLAPYVTRGGGGLALRLSF